jgi:hypothetical protein
MDKLTREVLICENTRTKSYYLLINPGCNESLGEEWSELEDCGAAQAQQEGRDAKVKGGGGYPSCLPVSSTGGTIFHFSLFLQIKI